MYSTPKVALAALVTVFCTQAVTGTDVVFRSKAECSGVLTYVAANVSRPIACYSMEGYGEVPSVNVVHLTAGHVVNFFSDGACRDAAATANDDGCFNPSQGSFTSFSIVDSTLEGDVPVSREAATYNIKMANFTDMALIDPYHIDVGFSVPVIAAAVIGASGLGLTFYSAVDACKAAKEDVTVNNIVLCLAAPLAVACSVTATHLYQRAGNVANARLDQRLGRTSDVKRRELVDGVLHNYLGGLPNSTYVGYMKHARYEQSGPMYEIEPVPGASKYHISAFFDEETGSLTHHLHTAEETKIAVRNAPYPFEDIVWASGGLDWNICVYNQDATSGEFNPDPSSYYNTFYDQLMCIFPNEDPYRSSTAMMIDMYSPSGTIAGELEIIPYTGSGPARSPPACTSQSAPVNGDCAIN